MGDQRRPEYGSDLVVDLMRATGIEYVALNPGATFRGLHDSIVNYGGNRSPEIIQVCHEEIAVAIGHGYAKAKGRPMAAICHDIVGLQHASMAVFNAWCDRVPVIVMGGGGPMDTTQRRPWIDWVHTGLVQGQVVRDYVKIDDQPFSVAAIPDSYLRAYRLATTEPMGPVYLCYDCLIQEEPITAPMPVPPVDKYVKVSRFAAETGIIEEAGALLAGAEFPVIMAGQVGRHFESVPVLIQLAEALGAPVVDLLNRFNFPSNHPLDMTYAATEVVSQADVVLVLDAQDIFGALRSMPEKPGRSSHSLLRPGAKVINVSLAELNTRSWAADFQEMHPVDLFVAADTRVVLPALLADVQQRLGRQASGHSAREGRRQAIGLRHGALRAEFRAVAERRARERPISVTRLVTEVGAAIQGDPWLLTHAFSVGKHWSRKLWNWDTPGQWLGYGAGAGLGYGSPASIGIALAHRGKDTLMVNLQSDGDFLYAATALWTAAHHRLPLLTVMVNNRTYYNDEEHQEMLAIARGRPPENKVVGMRIEDPAINFAKLAEAQGMLGIGPIEDPDQVGPAVRRAVEYVKRERLPALVDVFVSNT